MNINIFNLNGEIYKETSLKNFYVTEFGKVAQIEFENNELKKYFLLKHMISDFGHHRVEINDKKYLVHRLVYECWGNEPLIRGLVIDHKDANPHNNHISNLIQKTQKENIQNAIEHGNFGHNHNTKISVFDEETNTTTEYPSIKDFFIAIKAPEYIINHGGLSGLKKEKSIKDINALKLMNINRLSKR